MVLNEIKKDKILILLLFLLFSSYILSFTKLPQSSIFYFLKFALSLIFIVVYILLNKSKIKISKENTILFSTLAVFSGIPIFFNATISNIVSCILLVVIYLPFIFIIFPNINKELMEKVLSIMYLSLFLFLFLPSIFLSFFNDNYYLQSNRYRFISYFNNPNELAQFCLVFFLLSFYYAFTSNTRINRKIISLLFSIISVYIIYLTDSRAVFLAVIVFVLFYVITSIFHFEKKQKSLMFLVILIIIMLILFSNNIFESNKNFLSYIDTLSSHRLSIWQDILSYDNLIFLFFGGFLQTHPQYQVITNAYVELFGKFGLIGLTLWCASVIKFLTNKNKTTKFDKYKTAIIFTYLLYYLFESGLSSIVNISSFFFWFMVSTDQLSNKKYYVEEN